MRFDKFVVVGFLLLALFVTGCEKAPLPLRSPSAPSHSLSGTITATPNVVTLGSPVEVRWTAESRVKVDACQNGQCVALPLENSVTSTIHTPTSHGQVEYRLLGIVAEPDIFVRLDEKTVFVQEAP